MYPSSSSWKTSVVSDTTFVYHFVDPDLKVIYIGVWSEVNADPVCFITAFCCDKKA